MKLDRTALNRVMLLSLSFMLLAVMMAPMVSAAPVNVFAVDDDHKKVIAGDPVSFEWILYNNDTVPYVVTPEADQSSNSDFNVVFDQSHITLYPGASKSILMTVNTIPELSAIVLNFSVTFTITQMNELSNVIIVNDTVQIEVVPLFGTMAGDNKILGIWENQMPSPLDGNAGAFAVSVGIWAAIALFVLLVADPILHALTSKTTTELDDIVLRIIRGPILILIVLFGAVSSLEILSLDRSLIANLELLYRISFILVMAWLFYKIYDGVLIYYGHELAKKTDSEVDDVLIPVLEKLGVIVIPMVAVMVIFSMFGYDLTVILAGFGFMGIVIGFAAQATLANFFAGLQMVIDRPFKIEDLLRLDNGDICSVRKIGMRSTTLYNTFTHELVIVPNNDIANKKIVNMVLPDRKLKIAVAVGVAYGTDVDLVKKLMFDAAIALPEVIKDDDHLPIIRFSEFADSSLNFTAFIWITDLDKQFKAASDYRTQLLNMFNQHNIEIPFPQSVVWLKDLAKAEDQ